MSAQSFTWLPAADPLDPASPLTPDAGAPIFDAVAELRPGALTGVIPAIDPAASGESETTP